ncbi:MAG: DUF58 domain-containing protein [Pirellula sp.]|jgi:uncharacterized protein (DUF58 family)|nr:DUF58 domain-containing protein [Pirellula sp.]
MQTQSTPMPISTATLTNDLLSVKPKRNPSWLLAPWRLIRSAKRAATPVTTRLTREGWQFAFMVAFVVLGAVLRDVNLLVILAGTLLALLLIQWRVCSKSMYGLTLYRKLPRSIQARKDFEIEVTVTNPKRWLGAWLVLAQDRIIHKPFRPVSKQVSQTIGLLFSSVPPGAGRTQRYRCNVQQRGSYDFLGSEITTRFPLGLMRGILPVKSAGSFTVQPAIGKLLPGWVELFDGKITGFKHRKSRSISDEGEFFGLRAYHPGDSPRWIHWRSSARMNELMVKQFQRTDSRELVIVLDLHSPSSTKKDAFEAYCRAEDLAVEFVASIAQSVATSNYAVLTVAIADHDPTLALRVQTRGQNTALLDRLGIAHGLEVDTLPKTLELLEREYRRVENLIVVSTRSKQLGLQVQNPEESSKNVSSSVVFWRRVVWLDSSQDELSRFFDPATASMNGN